MLCLHQRVEPRGKWRLSANIFISASSARRGVRWYWLPVIAAVLFAAGYTWAVPIDATDKDALEANVDLSGQSRIDRALQVAITRMAADDTPGAMKLLESLSQSQADDRRVWYLLAACYYHARKLDRALDSGRRCLRIDQSWQPAHWLIATIHLARGDLSSARWAYDNAIKVNADSPGGYYQRGRFLIQYHTDDEQMVRAGIVDLRNALQRGAPADSVHGLIGKAHRALGENALAERAFQRVLEVKTDHPDALYELARLYHEQGRHRETEDMLMRLRAVSPVMNKARVADVAVLEARHATATGQADSVIETHYKRAVQSMPERSAGVLEFARWMDIRGRNAETIAMLRRALTASPDHADLAAQLAWALADTGRDLREARRLLAIAKAHDPENPYLADTEAWIEYRSGDTLAARRLLEPSLPLAGRVPEIAYHAGVIHARLGERSKAIGFLQSALSAEQPFGRRDEARRLLAQLRRER